VNGEYEDVMQNIVPYADNSNGEWEYAYLVQWVQKKKSYRTDDEPLIHFYGIYKKRLFMKRAAEWVHQHKKEPAGNYCFWPLISNISSCLISGLDLIRDMNF
jgi:hypothetical protein